MGQCQYLEKNRECQQREQQKWGRLSDPVTRTRPSAHRCHQPWNRGVRRNHAQAGTHRPQGVGAARVKQSLGSKGCRAWVGAPQPGAPREAGGEARGSTASLAGRLGGVGAERGRSTAGRWRGRSQWGAQGKPGKLGRGGRGGACGGTDGWQVGATRSKRGLTQATRRRAQPSMCYGKHRTGFIFEEPLSMDTHRHTNM